MYIDLKKRYWYKKIMLIINKSYISYLMYLFTLIIIKFVSICVTCYNQFVEILTIL